MKTIVQAAIALIASSSLLAALDLWTPQPCGAKSRFRGVSAVSDQVAWASGAQGTFVRTIDGGRSWKASTVSGAADLDFRDIHAFDAKTAVMLAAGEGAAGRIYRTDDGGATWSLRLTNPDPKGFLDAIAFWDADHGLAMGDPVDGRFAIFATDDGGRSWRRMASSADAMPAALPGEGGFAASGTCLTVQGSSRSWFGTGGAGRGRVFRSTDRGRTWSVAETPIRADSPASGIFSLAFQDDQRGVAIGGDYRKPDQALENFAATSDGGRTWRLAKTAGLTGYRSAIAFLPGGDGSAMIAAGPSGSDLSQDGGATWRPLTMNSRSQGFHALSFATDSAGAGWAVGDDGLIARFSRPQGHSP